MDFKKFRQSYGRGLPLPVVSNAFSFLKQGFSIEEALTIASVTFAEKFQKPMPVRGYYLCKEKGGSVAAFDIEAQSEFALEYIVRHSLFNRTIAEAKATIGENCCWKKKTFMLDNSNIIGVFNNANGKCCGVISLRVLEPEKCNNIYLNHIANIIAFNAVFYRRFYDKSSLLGIKFKDFLLERILLKSPFSENTIRHLLETDSCELEDIIVLG